MRSRDGSRAILLRLFIITTLPFLLKADEYLISLRYIIKDSYLYNDSLWISKAMSKCSGELSDISLTLESQKDLKTTIKDNPDEFFTYLQKVGLSVKSHDKTTNLINSNTTEIELRTTCFKVDFNENLAKITAINK
ncbi:MAG: hypothetical protein WC144_03070 [Sulfurimonas sp.]|nr:hypothetical protein [Sulfurimonadaceae bacterium]